jgi:uncharacterized protein with ATP-grasp and redox domains
VNVHPDCVPCLLKRVLFQSKLANNGSEKKAAQAALRTYADSISFEENSAKIATLVHRSAYRAMGVRDPYAELKIRADGIAGRYIGDLEKIISESPDPFAAAVKISIIGNIMDFGSGIAIDDPDEFMEMFPKLMDQDIEHNDTCILRDLVRKSSSVVYIFDNCGEVQFDRLLIKEIKHLGKRIVGVVKGEPILNDVSVDDALRIGIDKDVNRLLTTGGFAIGIDMDIIGDDLREEIRRADLIIAKGMANYESLSDVNTGVPVAYLMKAKCDPVARSAGVRLGSNVVKVDGEF